MPHQKRKEFETSMTWQQVYDPFGNKLLSAAVSALPVLTLFFVLVGLKKKVWVSALCGLVMAVALALLVFKMPAVLVATAAAHGFIFGLLRIAWIVVGSIFLYNVALETGQFQVMKESIAALSSDKRLQLVLIAFCFGAFLEGTGGGGAPVAIAGAFLIGPGVQPVQGRDALPRRQHRACGMGRRRQSDPDAGRRHGIAGSAIQRHGRPHSAAALADSAVLAGAQHGRLARDTPGVAGACWSADFRSPAMQFYWSNYQDIGLVDVVAAVFSLLVTVAFLKVLEARGT